MKLLLTALCATLLSVPASFGNECNEAVGSNEKPETGSAIAHCGKCKGDKDHGKEKEEVKEEGTLA